MFSTVGIISKPGDARVSRTLHDLVDFLAAHPVSVHLDPESARLLPGRDLPAMERDALGKTCELIVVVGGDGTFLSSARSLVDHEVRMLGINLGRLGFLTDLTPDDMLTGLSEVLSGEFVEDQRLLLELEVERDGAIAFRSRALNDVVLHKWNIARLIEFETFINGRLLNSQRSDGLIVATPTGSTAYALSGGGPILHPDLDAVVLVPICPHTLSSRPIVVHGSSRVEMHIGQTLVPEAQVTCDGQMGFAVSSGDRLTITRHPCALRLIHPPGHDHYATLRAKLHWGREL